MNTLEEYFIYSFTLGKALRFHEINSTLCIARLIAQAYFNSEFQDLSDAFVAQPFSELLDLTLSQTLT